MSEHASLPLGTKEIFITELRSLHNSKEKLTGDRYTEKLNDQDLESIGLAEQILMAVIEKAPSLLALEDDD
ncbi:MAG: hypothetical protein FJX52_10310 [Alphaproteobacteria bacterium]|nr:hypothetical protein [Alphaproteobacteria bacterium]